MRALTRLLIPLLCLTLTGCQSVGYYVSRVQARIQCPMDPMNTVPAWSPDSTRIAYVRQVPSNHPVIVEVATGDAQHFDAVTNTILFALWSPDGNSLLISTADPATQQTTLLNIAVADAQTVSLMDVQAPETLLPESWSPDSSRLIAQVSEVSGDTLYLMDADGANATILNDPMQGRALNTAWSPDGSQILYLFSQGNLPELLLAQADGSEIRKLFSSSYIATDFFWTPDGKQIAFGLFDPANNWIDLIVMDVQSHAYVTIATEVVPPVQMSPDGLSMLHMNLNGDVVRTQIDGSGTQIVQSGMLVALYGGIFSPDGTQLAYVTDDNGMPELFVTDLNSGNSTKLTHNPGHRLCFK